jgi:hypothetical protein
MEGGPLRPPMEGGPLRPADVGPPFAAHRCRAGLYGPPMEGRLCGVGRAFTARLRKEPVEVPAEDLRTRVWRDTGVGDRLLLFVVDGPVPAPREER